MKDGLNKENVTSEYLQAARQGRIDLMMQIDESGLSSYISKEMRVSAIQNILGLAPYPILQHYLYCDVNGVDKEMRGMFFRYAKAHSLVSAEDLKDSTTPSPEPEKDLRRYSF